MVGCKLQKNIHLGLPSPSKSGTSYFVKGSYDYHHYLCDGTNDRGWGCGYRTLQSLCSWIVANTTTTKVNVPSILQIQEILVKLEDKPPSFVGSRDWIGSFEVCLVIDYLFDVPCKIIHTNKGKDLCKVVSKLQEHFTHLGSPLMMGGNKDCSSKGIMGIHSEGDQSWLLIVDPHYVGKTKTASQLQQEKWVKWQVLEDFIGDSFYNICMPQIKPDDIS